MHVGALSVCAHLPTPGTPTAPIHSAPEVTKTPKIPMKSPSRLRAFTRRWSVVVVAAAVVADAVVGGAAAAAAAAASAAASVDASGFCSCFFCGCTTTVTTHTTTTTKRTVYWSCCSFSYSCSWSYSFFYDDDDAPAIIIAPGPLRGYTTLCVYLKLIALVRPRATDNEALSSGFSFLRPLYGCST